MFLLYAISTPKVKTKGGNGDVAELGVSCNADAISVALGMSPHIRLPIPLPFSLPLSCAPSLLCISPVKCCNISVVLMRANNIEVKSAVLGAGGNAPEKEGDK